MINLNNAGLSPTPAVAMDQMIRDIRFTNELPQEHLLRTLEPRAETVRRELAEEFGCDAEEIALTRNATESNMTMIFGVDLKRGDEVIFTTQNYPRMISAWRQRERRDGLVLKPVVVPTPVPSDDVYLERIADAITPRTRVIEVMHLCWMTGYVPPVRRIVDLARPKGIKVFVDGAQAFAHIPFKRDELGCDYYGTSLHKWLYAPVGTGFLYVRRSEIPRLWALFAGEPTQDADIRKFEQIGTHPAANHNAVAAAMMFHRGIGAGRKIARLRFLRDRWANRLLKFSDRVKMITPIGPSASGAIGVVHIDGMDHAKLGGWLMREHRIVTTPMVNAEFTGVRVSPSVYTTIDEVDLFADRVERAIRGGLG
jgi:selenocysteine lyase/cysteine desulfurase